MIFWRRMPCKPQKYASAEGYNGEKASKMTPISLARTSKKRLRPLGDRSVELGFGVCFQ